MWNKIVNPKTGRKVNVNSKIGKSVLRNYMKQIGGAVGLVPHKIKLIAPAPTPEQEVSITESQKPSFTKHRGPTALGPLKRQSGNRKLIAPAPAPEQELDDQKRDLSVPLKQPHEKHFFPRGFFDEGFYTSVDKKVLGLN